jgi:hypothetical protein
MCVIKTWSWSLKLSLSFVGVVGKSILCLPCQEQFMLNLSRAFFAHLTRAFFAHLTKSIFCSSRQEHFLLVSPRAFFAHLAKSIFCSSRQEHFLLISPRAFYAQLVTGHVGPFSHVCDEHGRHVAEAVVLLRQYSGVNPC